MLLKTQLLNKSSKIDPIYKAVVNGNRDIAEYLLNKTDRACVKTVDRDGRSALHYAAAFAQEDDHAMFGWLMMMGADKTQADNVSTYGAAYIYTQYYDDIFSILSFCYARFPSAFMARSDELYKTH